MMMKLKLSAMVGLMCALMLSASVTMAEVKSPRAPQWPDPAIRDLITHNRGNIATTVENYGYIAGFKYAGLASGRWPANSDRDYLAEMKFWVGGLDDDDNVYVDNTDDDFNPLPSFISGTESYNIRLSTDTTRFDFDAADTIGAGSGNPAKGWRVWDAQQNNWVYEQRYSVIDATFHNSGPLGLQESVCRYGDDGTGQVNMGLVVTQTVRQWDYDYNKDMIFINMQITNTSDRDYHDLAIGVYSDFDIGGNDPVSGDNGRLGDMVAYDTTLGMAWSYDVDGYDPAWGRNIRTGLMGTVFLSTPQNVGMTSLRNIQWELMPQDDAGRYDIINSEGYDEPLPPNDQVYLQSARGMSLAAGQTVEFNFALVAGQTLDQLKGCALRAKSLFANNYIGPEPPKAAHLTAIPGDHAVMLHWDNVAETSIEPTSGLTDFKGYRIYRSSDQGQTWGVEMSLADVKGKPAYSTGPFYYEMANLEPDELGRIAHTYVDSNSAQSSLTNGVEYWYAVCAYDTGAPNLGIDTLQNAFGTPETASNIVRATPRANPLGYLTPQQSLLHGYTGQIQKSIEAVQLYIVDTSAITGHDYRVAFDEVNCMQTRWNLIDMTTHDTVLLHQDQFNVPAEFSTIVDGMQVVVKNTDRTPRTAVQTHFAQPGDTTMLVWACQVYRDTLGCNDIYRKDYEIRFTATGSTAYERLSQEAVHVPYEVWDVTTNRQVATWIRDWGADGEWTEGDPDYIYFTDFDYDNGVFHPESWPNSFAWLFVFDPTGVPQTGDVMLIKGSGQVSPEDYFDFSSDKVLASYASANLSRIKVVPNPYIGNASWETTKGIRRLEFINLPATCDIRVYTLSGDLVRTINHTNGTGAEDWNMQSETGREIAAGIYFFNIDSQYGRFTGKFAVIK